MDEKIKLSILTTIAKSVDDKLVIDNKGFERAKAIVDPWERRHLKYAKYEPAIAVLSIGVSYYSVDLIDVLFGTTENPENLMSFVVFFLAIATMTFAVCDACCQRVIYRGLVKPTDDDKFLSHLSLEKLKSHVEAFNKGDFASGFFLFKHHKNSELFSSHISVNEQTALFHCLTELGSADQCFKLASYMKQHGTENNYYLALKVAESKGSLRAAKELAKLLNIAAGSSCNVDGWLLASLALGIVVA